jgi:hypothetical protein
MFTQAGARDRIRFTVSSCQPASSIPSRKAASAVIAPREPEVVRTPIFFPGMGGWVVRTLAISTISWRFEARIAPAWWKAAS